MRREERIKMVKAMEFIACQVNDCDVFTFWRSIGVADYDIEYGDLESPEVNGIQDDAGNDLEMYYEDDTAFSDLMDTFLVLMLSAFRNGGLYCDGVWSELLKHGKIGGHNNG